MLMFSNSLVALSEVVNFYFFYAVIGTRAMSGYAYCPESALAPLHFVLEYALWRGWHQAVIYTPELEQAIYLIVLWIEDAQKKPE
ncbi:unnamed protein product [Arctia plantaginis]|uniref:Uncharacterized protein n=1 Tax=Arctia plantaginis TaxID=874455 RepID=A0A8S1ARN3_ARCPL|nr:unnamed protein product [Arctia plantaginis]CAB3247607.1 unnamed protein product [Arctia plantaginis]